MSPSRPPRAAHWLLTRWTSGARRESVVGDIFEQYQRGRSSTWYWRQTISAVAATFATETSQHKMLAASVVALSISLPDIYTWSRVWVWVGAIDRLWYPRLIHSRLSWLAINPWAYRLQPYWWTSDIAWCAILAGLSWIMTRLFLRQRGLVVSLFLITQVGIRLPYLQTVLMDWLLGTGNPIWLFNLLWFATLSCLMAPLSILAGSAAAVRRTSVASNAR